MIHKIPQRKNIFEAFYNKISKPISKIIVKTPLTPNQITIISGIFGIVAANFLINQTRLDLIYAAVFIQLYTIFDLVDGDIARIKKMHSHFGKWLDIFFDKLNDILLILGFSIGVYLRTEDIYVLYLGMALMGLIFFIQFSMIMNSIIFVEAKRDKGDTNIFEKSHRQDQNNHSSFLHMVRKIIGRHLLLEHSTFLFLISLFCVIDQTELGLLFITIHALFTKLYIIFSGIYKLRNLENNNVSPG